SRARQGRLVGVGAARPVLEDVARRLSFGVDRAGQLGRSLGDVPRASGGGGGDGWLQCLERDIGAERRAGGVGGDQAVVVGGVRRQRSDPSRDVNGRGAGPFAARRGLAPV